MGFNINLMFGRNSIPTYMQIQTRTCMLVLFTVQYRRFTQTLSFIWIDSRRFKHTAWKTRQDADRYHKGKKTHKRIHEDALISRHTHLKMFHGTSETWRFTPTFILTERAILLQTDNPSTNSRKLKVDIDLGPRASNPHFTSAYGNPEYFLWGSTSFNYDWY